MLTRRDLLKNAALSAAGAAAVAAAGCAAQPQRRRQLVNDVDSALNPTWVLDIARPGSLDELQALVRARVQPRRHAVDRRRPPRDGRPAVRHRFDVDRHARPQPDSRFRRRARPDPGRGRNRMAGPARRISGAAEGRCGPGVGLRAEANRRRPDLDRGQHRVQRPWPRPDPRAVGRRRRGSHPGRRRRRGAACQPRRESGALRKRSAGMACSAWSTPRLCAWCPAASSSARSRS